jgi:thiol-disulfide isomerase/thioredoxin
LGYKIYRDSLVIQSSQTELSYTDANVYPGKYKYVVKAIYSTGLSQPTDPVEALIQGGTARKYVLLEIATGTWCTYCPGSAMGADDLVESGANVAVIEYHDNDDYENNDANQRNSYYNITGYPTAKFDGSTTISGGNMTQSMYPSYLPVYNNHIKKLSLFDLDMVVIQSGESELQISITTKKIYAYENNNLRLHLVLTETHIPENWQGIMTEVNSVCRKMYPDYKGNVADFSNDSVLVFNYTITVDTTFEFNNCALVAFIQDNATKEVLQVDNINFNSLGRTEPEEINTSVYPNPCSGSFCLSITQKGTEVYKMEIQNNFGACVYRNDDLRVNGTFKQYFDVHNLSDGMYNLILRSDKHQISKKIVINK